MTQPDYLVQIPRGQAVRVDYNQRVTPACSAYTFVQHTFHKAVALPVPFGKAIGYGFGVANLSCRENPGGCGQTACFAARVKQVEHGRIP